MTNRERIMADLAALSDEDFWRAFGPADLANRLSDTMCRDCAARRPDASPEGDDAGACPSMGEWMSWDCRAERMLSPAEWD